MRTAASRSDPQARQRRTKGFNVRQLPVMISLFVRLWPLLLISSFACAQSPSDTIRVLSYNIHHGEGVDQVLDLERIAKLILEAKADIVGLQEVDRGVERSGKRDLPAELAKLTGMRVHFEKNIPHQGGEYGNAVLTRFPIKSAKNTHLKQLAPGEQRGVQQLVLDVRGREIVFINTHIDYRANPPERTLDAEALKQMVADAGKRPVILVGDFNAMPTSPFITSVKSFIADAWEITGKGDGFTIPVKKPTRRIDYVFVSKETVTPVRLEVIPSIASDHLPLLAELRLK